MASSESENLQMKREMQMMRFIFGLPVGDIKCLPKNNRWCILCDFPYNPVWGIKEDYEIAVVLPCGHFIGSDCILTWLSPFKEGRVDCPHRECGFQFPCPVNERHDHGQAIIRGKLAPRVRAKSSKNSTTIVDTEAMVDSGRGSDGDDDYDYEDCKEDSGSMKELMNEIANCAINPEHLNDDDLLSHIVTDLPSLNPAEKHPSVENEKSQTSCKEHEDVSIIDSEERGHAESAEAEACDINKLSNWAMICDILGRIKRRRVNKRAN